MPGKTPSPSPQHKSRSRSPSVKGASSKTPPRDKHRTSPGKTPSPDRRKTPGIKDKSPSPNRRSRSGSGKRDNSGKRDGSRQRSGSGKRDGSRQRSSSGKRDGSGKINASRSGSSKRGRSGKGRSPSADRKSGSDASAPHSAASRKKNPAMKPPEVTERGLKVLDYSGQGMTNIPASLLATKEIGVLILASNNLRTLPLELRKLTSLFKLDLSRNGIRCTHPADFTGVPRELEQLADLEELKISECNLPYVPPAIWQLTSLRLLDLSRNKINILPPEVGQLLQLSKLNLQQTNITSLPPEIAYCQELEEILLWGNSIESLPDTLPEMPKLRVLALNYRSFCGVLDPYMEKLLKKRQINSEHIPVVVFELPALEALDLESTKLNNLPDVYNIALKEFYLCHNFLQTVPPTLYSLRYLQILDMSYNLVQTLPEDIGRLQSLRVLRLNNNGFERLPPSIGQLHNLTELNLAANKIRRLPPEIRHLQELRTLRLEDNALQTIPDEVCELSRLETLDLTNNAVKTLPIKLYKLQNLQVAHSFRKLSKHGLWLYNNPLEQPPPPVWRTDKPDNIYSHLKMLIIKRTQNLQRQKILVLGASQAGKTSLVRVLGAGKSSLTRPALDCTRLLEQRPCQTPNNVRFTLLDFGGHAAYVPMHRLFLDRKALALIVYDASSFQQEHYSDSVGRWIQMLMAFTPGVVVKLVATQCDRLEENTGHQDVVCQLVKKQMQDYRHQLQAELDSVQADLAPLADQQDLSEAQEYAKETLTTRKERLNSILSCQLRILPTVSSVSATDSLQGIQELVSELEHLAIDRALLPHAQRKVPSHWQQLKATLKRQEGYYLLWEDAAESASEYSIKEEEVRECLQYYCDTGDMLWYPDTPGLSQIVFHKPRLLVQLLASIYRHDIQHFLQYPDNQLFYSKGRLTQEGFAATKDMFLQLGQVSRPLLTCLWFDQRMSPDTLTDLLELLPLLDLCYTVPEPDVPTGPLHHRPLLVLPYYNQDDDLSSLGEVWPDNSPEKTLTVVYHFPVVFPLGVFQQVSASIQDLVITRMDWRRVIYAATETEKMLLRQKGGEGEGERDGEEGKSGSLLLAVRGQDFSSMQDLMQQLMEMLTQLLKKYPGLYWKVDVQGSSLKSFLKVV